MKKIRKNGRCYKCEKRDGKANYNSEADARAGAFFLWANGKITIEELNDVQPYRCEHNPQYWHVGHRSYYEQKTKLQDVNHECSISV